MNDKHPDQGAPATPPSTPAPAPEPAAPTFDLQIEKLVTGGAGLARQDGQAVFVPLTAPGDHIQAEVVEQRKGFVRAKLTEIIKPGPGRQEASCPHYGECGGCDLQHLDAATQRQAKADIVADCFQRLGKMDVSEIITGPDNEKVLGYRNRIRVFASPAGYYGMMRRGTHDVVPLESCDLMPEQFNKDILPWLRFLPPVEQVIVRMDGHGNWLLSIFGLPARMKVMKKILAATPDDEAPAEGCVGLLYNNLPLWGRDHLVYEVAGHKYRVSAQSFFQGNFSATEDAVATVRAWVDEISSAGQLGGLLGDLYCGVGLFSLALADQFEKVVAVDTDKNSYRDATNNVKHSAELRDRITLRQGSMVKMLGDDNLANGAEWESGLCLVDPPRAGLGKSGVKSIIARKPRQVVYMSCDPATMARDTAALVEAGYVVRKLKVMDFFPQTAHIECLMLLERSS